MTRPLPPGVHVRWGRIEEPDPGIPALTPGELARIPARRFPDDHTRSVLASRLMKAVAADALGIRVTGPLVGAPVVLRRCVHCGSTSHGRPYAEGVHLSAGHAGEYAVAVACVASLVGVDLDRAPEDWSILLPQLLADGESVSGAVEFARLWTAKEALVKATGEGLAGRPLTDVRVQGPGPSAQFYDLEAPDGYIATLALLSP